jgi:hypothetical protein
MHLFTLNLEKLIAIYFPKKNNTDLIDIESLADPTANRFKALAAFHLFCAICFALFLITRNKLSFLLFTTTALATFVYVLLIEIRRFKYMQKVDWENAFFLFVVILTFMHLIFNYKTIMKVNSALNKKGWLIIIAGSIAFFALNYWIGTIAS